MNINFLIKAAVLSLVFILTGCAHFLDEMGLRDETVYPPTYPVDNPPPPKKEGGIYQAGHEITLYNDRIASRVGDILTVRLEELTQGEKKAKTITKKTASNTFPTPTWFGQSVPQLNIETSTDQEFDGEGESHEQNKLRGTISVTVVRVLSNGNMVVQGESWVTINQGREYMRLAGIVRPEDIEQNNVVSSQRIADARISYSGGGQVGNSSRGGIGTLLFSKFWPY